MTAQVYRVICNGCGWKGERTASASDKCPECNCKVRLTTAESRGILRETIKRATAAAAEPVKPVPIARELRVKDAPKDEGSWEFRWLDGVLTVIAWDDNLQEAKCVRLTRRGMDIYIMQQKEQEEHDGTT